MSLPIVLFAIAYFEIRFKFCRAGGLSQGSLDSRNVTANLTAALAFI